MLDIKRYMHYLTKLVYRTVKNYQYDPFLLEMLFLPYIHLLNRNTEIENIILTCRCLFLKLPHISKFMDNISIIDKEWQDT